MTEVGTAPDVTIVPANEASWDDLEAVFGTRGDPSRCWCQRFKMQPGESWASVGAEALAFRLREQTDCGHPESATTSGLVAYLDGVPVGWCAVEPRTAYPRLLLKSLVPWAGRDEDKSDGSVWGDLLRHPHGLPPSGRRPCARAGRCRLRAGARRACPRGLSDDHPAGARGRSDRRAACRQPRPLRGRRVRRGLQPTVRRVVMRIDF